jgi:hypothetical protein
MFFDMLLCCASKTEACSLESAASMVYDLYRLKITKQSIDERFNVHAVIFVKEILTRALEKQFNKCFNLDFLPLFNHIRIKDGTRFIVPDRLSPHYPGSGGSQGTSKASICIQFEYDARSGKILSLDITEGKRNDQTVAKETATNVELGDLIIRDLGYYSLPTLKSFDKAGAFFISRLGTSTIVYDADSGEGISFKRLYSDMEKNKSTRIEKNIFGGKTERMPLRLIVETVPEEVYKKRIRRIEKENKSTGYNTSDEYKARCRLNIFITNIQAQDLSMDEVLKLYMLRWQIELMFKNWKSICKINKIQPMKFERYTCLLYAKLILIVVNLQLIWNLKRFCYAKKQKILSLFKCFKTMQDKFEDIYKFMRMEGKISIKSLRRITTKLSKNHWKEKRKKRINYEDILDLFLCKSNI